MPDLGAGSAFTMYGARNAMAGGMLHIEEQVNGIEQAVEGNPGLAFDLAKTIVESACRTILTERGIAFNPDDDVLGLFKMATRSLPFLPTPAADAAEVRKSLAQTLGGLHTAVRGVCELRNACGFASHGSDAPRPAMESVQARLAAETADAIVGFLYGVHQQDQLPKSGARAEYDGNPAFNDYVDEANDLIRIFDAEFRPSEVLFHMEPESYRVYLAEFEPQTVKADPQDGAPEISERP